MRLWPRRRTFLPVALPKKSVPAYHSLLLRAKKRPLEKNPATPRSNFSLSFWWQRYRGILSGVTLGIIVFGLLLGVFFLTGFFSVRDIALIRADLRVNVPAVARALISFKGQNILSVSGEEIKAALQQKFPEISEVSLERDFPGNLRITVSTFPIVAQWEFRLSAASSGGKSAKNSTVPTLFVNRNGQVSNGDPAETEPPFLLIETVEKLPENLIPGTPLYPAQYLQNILDAKAELAKIIPFALISAEIFRAAQEVHFQTAEGTEFWLDFFTPFSEQIAKVQTALQKHNIFEEPVQYLDLRIPGKLIYHPKK